MGGGGSKSSKSKVKMTQFDTDPSHYVNLGYQQTPNTFTAQGKPSWMQGNFAMDSWGKSAADPRISLTQDMLSPYGAPIHNEAVKQMGQYDQQMAQYMANPTQGAGAPQMPAWMTQPGGGQPMTMEQAMAMNARPVMPQQAQAPKAGKGPAEMAQIAAMNNSATIGGG